MDIALIMHELLVEGGGERQCVSLARELALQGHEITLYTSAYSLCWKPWCEMSRRNVAGQFSGKAIKYGRVCGQNRRDMGKYNETQEAWFPTESCCSSPWVVRQIGLLDEKGTSF